MLSGGAVGSVLLLVRRGRLALRRRLPTRVVRLRRRRRRRSLLAPSQELLHIFIILLAEHARPLLPLQQQVVRRGDVVEAIFLNLNLSLVSIDVVIIDEHAHDLRVNRNRLFAYVNRWCVRGRVLADLVPRVVANVLNCETLRRVRVEDVADQVLRLL